MNELSVCQPELIVKLKAKSNGSLNDLMQKAKQEYDLSGEAFKRSVEHMWHMGKLLTEAHAEHRVLKKENGKDQPNWDVLLKEFGISVASDYRAKRVYKTFPVLEKISGLSITEAYEAAGIPKSESKPKVLIAAPLEPNGVAKVDSKVTDGGSDSDDDLNEEESDDDDLDNEEWEEANDDELNDEASTEDDFDSEEDDVENQLSFVDLVLDASANMEALRDRNDPLSDEEIKEVLAEVELILECAVQIKMRLEEVIDAPERSLSI